MAKKKGGPRSDQRFTCPNSSCGMTFTKPVKVKNLTQENSNIYDACPRCLTSITPEENGPVTGSGQSSKLDETREEEVVCVLDEKKTESPKVQCTRHFGYLSERAKNEKIPDDCMFCGNIVKCMLKTVNG